MTKLYPSVVIGLGDAGSDIARRVADLLVQPGETELTALTRTLTLDAAGLHAMGAPDTSTTVVLQGLDADVSPGVWAANYRTILDQSRTVREQIERAVHEVRSYSRAVGFGRRSVDIGDNVTFYLVGSLCDPIGSAALIPVLAVIHEAFQRAFLGMSARVQVTLLSHDLLPEGPAADTLLKGRAFAALQELELVLDGTPHLPHPVGVHLAWLLSSRNEENLFLGGYLQLVPVIAHQILSMLRGEVLQDLSGTNMFHQRPQERATRYSSFGFAKMIFPREHLLDRATDAVAGQVLAEIPARKSKREQASAVYADVKSFVHENRLDELPDLLGRNASGNEIWRPYTPPTSIAEEADAETVLHRLLGYDAAYEKEHATAMQHEVGDRRMHLVELQRNALEARVRQLVGSGTEVGSLASAEAWLAALVEDRGCEWIQGDPATEPLTLSVVDGALHRYFDPQFSPLLFGGSPDASLGEYAARNRLAIDDRRGLLRALEHDLDQKVRTLEEGRDDRDARLSRLEEVEKELGDAAGMEPQSGEAQTPESPVEVEGEWSPAGSAENPNPVRRAALLSEHLKASAEEENEATLLAGIENEVAQLRQLYSTVQGQVTRLDRAIKDSAERGRLFRPLLDERRARIGEAEEALRESTRVYRSKRAELEECAERRKRWVLVAGVLFVFFLALLAGSNLFFELPRRVPGWAYGLIVASGLAYGVWRYWNEVRRRYRDLREATRALNEQRARRREALVAEHRTLHRFVFDHHRYSMLVDWRTELGDFIAEVRRDLRVFRVSLDELAASSTERGERLDLEESPFLEYLLPEAGVAGLLAEREADLALLRREVWREKDFAAVFTDFRLEGSGALDGLVRRIADAVRGVFKDLAAMNAEEFLAYALPSEHERRSRVTRLFRHAAPFAKRVAEDGTDKAERLAYLGVPGAPEKSLVRAALPSADAANVYESRSESEVTVMRLALGFPAFQFAPMSEARSHFDQLSGDLRASLYVEPAWLNDVQDLQPSLLRLGGADDRHRQLACLALAYGIAVRVPDVAGGKDRIRYADMEFESYAAWVLHFGELAGMRVRKRVEDELSKLRQRITVELPAPVELLRAYRDQFTELDPVDQQIIDEEIADITSVCDDGGKPTFA